MEEKTIKQDVEALRGDFKQIKDDLLGLTRAIGQLTAKQAAEGVGDLKQAGDRVQAQLRQAAEEAKDSLEHQVKERPLGTLLIAFGIGLLLGKSMSRG